MKRRGSGLLLHITSLPSPYGIGDLGPDAYAFAEFLHRTRQSFWQILPLSPTIPSGHSPYNGSSAFAGNPLLISPDFLVREGLLDRADLRHKPDFPANTVRFEKVLEYKEALLRKAYAKYRSNYERYDSAILEFSAGSTGWLPAYTAFAALRKHFRGKPWNEWGRALRERDPDALKALGQPMLDSLHYETFLQYIFRSQWNALKSYCNKLGIRIIGDTPYYVSYDSADVWTNPEIFKLDRNRKPLVVSGVPPDYFSATGQLWGNPVYDWDRLKQTGYRWWLQRLKRNFELFDLVRIDHFRGLVSYWEVPAREKTAIRGRWVDCPVDDFFNMVFRHIPHPALIAEDLGLITADVREAIRRLDFPGMRVLQFAFGGDPAASPHIPHRLDENLFYYTGTHDNNTILGWFRKEASADSKKQLERYIGKRTSGRDLNWDMIRLTMMSIAATVIIPVQDILGLGADARMNKPATPSGNWKWRLAPGMLTRTVEEKLRDLTEIYGRA